MFGQLSEKMCNIDGSKKNPLKLAEQQLQKSLDLRLEMLPFVKETINGSYDPINLLDRSVKENVKLKEEALGCEKWLIENVDKVKLPFLASFHFEMT